MKPFLYSLSIWRDVYEHDPKVGAAEVERQELSLLLAVGQLAHVGREALDGGRVVRLLVESPLDGQSHLALHQRDVVVVDDEVAAVVLDLPAGVGDGETLVAVQQDGVRRLPAEQLPVAVAFRCRVAERDDNSHLVTFLSVISTGSKTTLFSSVLICYRWLLAPPRSEPRTSCKLPAMRRSPCS